MSYVYLQHHGIKGQKWGVRRFQNDDGTYTAAGRRRRNDDEGPVSTLKKKIPRPVLSESYKKQKMPKHVLSEDGYMKQKTPDEINMDLYEKAKKVSGKVRDKLSKSGNTEIAKRGKSAIDVLMNGDTDWMGNHTHSDDATSELKNRGKAALERLMYSQEQIDNKKFFGRYDF